MIVLLFGLPISGCVRSIAPPLPNTQLVQISDVASSGLKKDEFTIADATIDDALLSMTVSSGGGCRKHDYTLTMTPSVFMESFPVQANLYLWHDANDDPCDVRIPFDSRDGSRNVLATGGYPYRFATPSGSAVRKMVIIKCASQAT